MQMTELLLLKMYPCTLRIVLKGVAMLQIRWSNRDNLGIISHSCP